MKDITQEIPKMGHLVKKEQENWCRNSAPSKSTGTYRRRCDGGGTRRSTIIVVNKVADTRPRFKGRFVSVDQADEFNKRLHKELQERMRKERVFVIQKLDRQTGQVRKTVYPTYEIFQQEMGHLAPTEHDSTEGRWSIRNKNEIVTYIGDIELQI